MKDDKRLVIDHPLGDITVALIPDDYRGKYLVTLAVSDDSTGDSERGFGSRASAYLTREKIAELIEFLGKLIAP